MTDPNTWITNLELLMRSLETMGCKISNMDLMQILQNSPEEYESALELCKYELEEEPYDIKKLKFKLRAK
jgi:hypothetical protein